MFEAAPPGLVGNCYSLKATPSQRIWWQERLPTCKTQRIDSVKFYLILWICCRYVQATKRPTALHVHARRQHERQKSVKDDANNHVGLPLSINSPSPLSPSLCSLPLCARMRVPHVNMMRTVSLIVGFGEEGIAVLSTHLRQSRTIPIQIIHHHCV